ncbi:flippase [Oryzomonas rubra]|uniref:Flippase n=2 Tax=Oryzomonas rubra TaxID=2509454 RepID=A0A5A9XK93_9BACT|nr:flippase [Oryzomonas rubra]
MTPAPTDRLWVRYLPSFLRKRFEDRHVFQEAVENSGWLFADKILRMGVGLLVGVWVARYLGPALFGQISYAGSLIGMVGAVAGLGLDSIVIRELVHRPDKCGEILGTTFILKFFAGIMSYFFVVGLVFVLRPDDTIAHAIVAILGWSLTVNALDVIDFWFQSKVLSKYVVIARNFGFIVSAIGRVILILAKTSVVSFAVMNLVELSLGAIALLYVYSLKNGSVRKWRVRLSIATNLLRTGWPVLLAGIISMVGLRIDQVILGQLADSKEVGIYAAAVRVAEVWFFIPSAVIASVFPSIIRAKEVDEAEFYNRLQKLYNVLAFVGYAVAVPVTFLAGIIIHLLYGKAYATAAPMLVILIWSDLFINLAMARGTFLLAMNWTWILFWVNVASAVVNIALNFFLIPKYGGVGAAAASCISYWISAHAICYVFKPLRRNGSMITHSLLLPKFW